MSPKEDNPLSNYAIIGNHIEGHKNQQGQWASSGIVIAQGYNPKSIGGREAKKITASNNDYGKILKENKFKNNKIDLTHQDWTKGLEDGPVLYESSNENE